MKSLLKPLLVGLLCLSLFANTASMAAQEPEPAQQAVAEKADVPPEAAAQGAALKAYFILRQHFQLDDLGKVVRYPDNYGGTYINEDNELVLCITVWDTWVDEAVKQVEQVKGPMKVQFCSASINEVVLEYFELRDLLPQELINSNYYSTTRNAYILTCYAEQEAALLQALQALGASEHIQTLVDEEICYDQEPLPAPQSPNSGSSYLYGGSLLYTGTSPIGTLGISGSYGTYTNCYLTAGHVAKNRSIGPTAVATQQLPATSLLQYEDGEEGDYAAVPAPSGYLQTNQVYSSSSWARSSITLYHSGNDLPQYTRVYKFGQATMLTYGKAVGLGGYQPSGFSFDFTSMIRVNNESHTYMIAPGDSGGPCWVYAEDYGLVLVGIVSGGRNTIGNPLYYDILCIDPICNAVSAGFTPYGMTSISSSSLFY